jgi:hypothetical protein
MAGQPAPSPRRHFLTERIGLLVSYAEAEVPNLSDTALAFLKKVNESLRDGPTLDIEDVEVFAYPIPTDTNPRRDDSMKPGNTNAPLEASTAILYPRITMPGSDRLPSPSEAVRLDVALRKTFSGERIEKLTLQEVSLDWLFSSGPESGIGTGGPGARPVLRTAQPSNPPINAPEFVQGTQHAGHKDGEGVKVVILDTAWPKDMLETAYRDRIDPGKPGAVHNALVEALLNPSSDRLQISQMPASDRDRLSLVQLEDHPYQMPDHGLFVAGIIHTIAPSAKLVLVEVLNIYGVGDLISITRGLKEVAVAKNDAERKEFSADRLLINCSLCMNLPFELSEDGTDDILNIRAALAAASVDEETWLLQESRLMQRVVDLLFSQGRKIIAAAGNESKDPAARPQARYPAAFASVLGVGAIPRQGSGQPVSSYSNLSDTPPPKGIVALGGEAGAGNGVLGLYLGQEPPASPGSGMLPGQPPAQVPNPPDPTTTGWAWWAGTSFATPIVTGVLARKLGKKPHGTAASHAVDELMKDPALAQGATPAGEDKLDLDQTV